MARPPNLAVFGWYHHRNAGDDRIAACLTRWLDGATLAFLPAGRRPPRALLDTLDGVLIGGGGLLTDPGGVFRDLASRTRDAGIPVALAGVSLEGDDPALVAELRAFLDVAAFAWFRDAGTLEAVGPHPRAFVAPDVTWLYPYPVAAAGDVMSAGDGIAVAIGTTARLDRPAWREALAATGRPLRPWPLYFEGGGDGRVLGELLPGAPLPDEWTLEPAIRSGLVVASRFHAVLFAIQLGRPFLALAQTPKLRRFLAEHGLDELGLDPARPEALPQAVERVLAAGDGIRTRLLDLRQRLTATVRSATDPVRDRFLASAVAQPPPSRRLRARLRRLFDLGFGDP